jgi:hypothetical protein
MMLFTAALSRAALVLAVETKHAAGNVCFAPYTFCLLTLPPSEWGLKPA